MTSAASLHFGPEWMRKPNRGAPTSPNPSMIPTTQTVNGNGPTPAPPTPSTTAGSHSSYSSLLSGTTPPPDNQSDDTFPFRYSKEQMLAVWRNGGGQGELGLEVERWPGIVREIADEPMGFKEFTPDEKKLFAMPYNSDPPQLRRRGDSYSSHSPLITTPGFDPTRDRAKLASPMRERFGATGPLGGPTSPGGSNLASLGRGRRKDENGQDVPLFRPRQLSLGTNGLSGVAELPASPGVGVGRPRLGGATFDGVLGTENWGGGLRRRVSEPRIPTSKPEDKMDGLWRSGDVTKAKEGIAEEPIDDWERDDFKDDLDIDGPLPTPISKLSDGGGFERAPSVDSANALSSRPASGASSRAYQEPLDLLSVQWVYKDPTGQVQGPFAAPVMQGWYAEGYFTSDLLLKRLDVDDTFEGLQDYRRRVVPPGTEDLLFISPFAPKQTPPIPPGLARQPIHDGFGTPSRFPLGRIDTGTQSPALENGSYAPSPTTPSSAYVTTGNMSATLPVAAHIANDTERQKRERDEFLRTLRERELAAQQENGYGDGNNQSMSPLVGSPFGGGAVGRNGLRVSTSEMANSLGIQTFKTQSPVHQTQMSPFGNSTMSPFSQQNYTVPQQNPTTNADHNHHSSAWGMTPHSANRHDSINNGFNSNNYHSGGDSSPWHSIIEPSTDRGMSLPYQNPQTPFNAIPPPIQSPWNLPGQHTLSQPNVQHASDFGTIGLQGEPSNQSSAPTQTTSAFPDDAQINDMTSGVESLDINRRNSVGDVSSIMSDQEVAPVSEDLSSWGADQTTTDTATSGQSQSEENEQVAIPAAKVKPAANDASGKKDTSNTKSSTSIPTSTPSTTIGSIPSHLPAKPAWSVGVFDDKIVSSMTPTTMSLRQIQDAEAKRSAEMKKQEKERAVKTSSATTPTAPVPSTVESGSSWGLPQLGKATPTPSSVSTPSPSIANTQVPGGVWTTKAAQSNKKSMKEIQEEEERRKKEVAAVSAAKETQAAVNASNLKRGYADSAKTTGTSTTPIVTGPWTTVGANGKATTAASIVTGTPRITTPTLANTRSAIISTPATSIATTPAKIPTSKTTGSSKTVEEAPPPSLEFVRWMKEALKGMTGVNLEETLQFLLQFPLDPPQSDLELISDTIYSYSSTLDGRRFAAEFVSKRKADASNAKQQGKIGTSTNAATTSKFSLADVVKTQLKPAQTDFGYKVVNKKKGKNGRGSAN